MKSHLTVTIDTDVLIELRKKDANISQLINSFLRDYLQFQTEGKKIDLLSEVNKELIQANARVVDLQERRKELVRKGQVVIE